ncbi:MAG: hypothetical protein RIQ70_1435, partial [Bacteroidota bacterium]
MKKLIFCLLFGLSIFNAKAQVNLTWTGTSGDKLWTTAGNWSPAAVPTAADNVTLGAMITPIIVTSSIAVRLITTTTGAKIDLQNGVNLSVSYSAMLTGLTLTSTSSSQLLIGTNTAPAANTLTITNSFISPQVLICGTVTAFINTHFYNTVSVVKKSGSFGHDYSYNGNIYDMDLAWSHQGYTRYGVLLSSQAYVPDVYKGNITLSCTTLNASITIGGNPTDAPVVLKAGKKILIDTAIGFTKGFFTLKNFIQEQADPFSLALGSAVTLTMGPKVAMKGIVKIKAGSTRIIGSTFNAKVSVIKTGLGNSHDQSNGGNIYNDDVDWSHQGASWAGGNVILSNGNIPDIYYGNIIVSTTVNNAIYIGSQTITDPLTVLKAGKQILINPTYRFNQGSLTLRNFSQEGLRLNELIMGSRAEFNQINAKYQGPLLLTAGQIDASSCTFEGNTVWNKLNPNTYHGGGNNTFNQDFTFTNASAAACTVPISSANVYMGNVTIGGLGTGPVLFAKNTTNFYKNLTIHYNNFQLGTFTGVANFVGAGTNQIINGTATVSPSIFNIKINNPKGVDLKLKASINYKLDLTLGNLRTTPSLYPTLLDGATFVNYSANSFVDGEIAREGIISGDVVIPIGRSVYPYSELVYRPVTISASSGSKATDKFIFRYDGYYPNPINPLFTAPLTSISNVLWDIRRLPTAYVNNANVSISFPYLPVFVGLGSDVNCVKSAKKTEGNASWEVQPNDVINVKDQTTSITTAATTGVLGMYTQGVSNPVTFTLPSTICVPWNATTFDVTRAGNPVGGTFWENGVQVSTNTTIPIAATNTTLEYRYTTNGCN